MGFSPCILANFGHFQNALIFRILGVFRSGFLHPTTLMWWYIHFSHLFGIFNFLAKLIILHGLQPMHIGQFWPFSKCSHFLNIRCFSERFLHPTTLMWSYIHFSHLFGILIFSQTDHFPWAIAHAYWPILAIFKMLSFFEY